MFPACGGQTEVTSISVQAEASHCRHLFSISLFSCPDARGSTGRRRDAAGSTLGVAETRTTAGGKAPWADAETRGNKEVTMGLGVISLLSIIQPFLDDTLSVENQGLCDEFTQNCLGGSGAARKFTGVSSSHLD